MEHISLGGLAVSRIGLGTMAMSGYYLDQPANIRTAVEGSLRRLGTDRIDLYYQRRNVVTVQSRAGFCGAACW